MLVLRINMRVASGLENCFARSGRHVYVSLRRRTCHLPCTVWLGLCFLVCDGLRGAWRLGGLSGPRVRGTHCMGFWRRGASGPALPSPCLLASVEA